MSSVTPPLPPSLTRSVPNQGTGSTGNSNSGNAPASTAPSSAPQQTTAQPQTPLPPQLSAQLQSGQPLRGTLLPPTPQQPANLATLQTALGTVIISGKNLPAPNTPLTLALALDGGSTAATKSTAGQLLQLTWQATPQTSASTTGTATSGAVTQNTLLGSQLTASSLPTNSVASLLTQTANHLSNQAAGATTSGPTGAPSGVTSGGPSSGGPAPTHAQMPNNHTMQVRVTSIQLPGQPALGQQAIGAAQTATAGFSTPMQGTVLASQAGNTIVQTPAGTMTLPISQALPTGTTLTLLPLGQATQLAPPSSNILLQERWAGLKDAMAMIQSGNPQAAQQIMQSIPQPNNQMASSMLFLISTLRGGAVENWIGRSNSARIGGPAGERLADSVRQSSRNVKDSSGQDWKIFGIPIQQDGDLSDLWLYLKDNPDEENQEDSDKGNAKRFVIEANFQKMGPLQLDGIATSSHIDLMLRSHIPVDRDMIDEIRALFGNTITALGLTGTIKFHVADHFPVTFKENGASLSPNITI